MDVSVRDLRNSTASVVAAVQAGKQVTLTVHGNPVADIVPHRVRQERRSAEAVYEGLDRVAALAASLNVVGETDLNDYESGLSSDDF
jgi:prevent-host-death family protein